MKRERFEECERCDRMLDLVIDIGPSAGAGIVAIESPAGSGLETAYDTAAPRWIVSTAAGRPRFKFDALFDITSVRTMTTAGVLG
jgi:hypothetical protein